jgi:hypothetical protein
MWLESHGNLARHPKTRRLMQRMGWTLPSAIGNLHLLWYWALEYAPTGDLTKFEPEQLTYDLDLGGATPEQFIEAMIHAGFIDRLGSGSAESRSGGTMIQSGFLDKIADENEDVVLLRLHDWPEYTAKSLRPNFRRKPEKWREVATLYSLPTPSSNPFRPAMAGEHDRNLVVPPRRDGMLAPGPQESASTCAEREPKLVGLALRAGRREFPSAIAEHRPQGAVRVDCDQRRSSPSRRGGNGSVANGDERNQSENEPAIAVKLDPVDQNVSQEGYAAQRKQQPGDSTAQNAGAATVTTEQQMANMRRLKSEVPRALSLVPGFVEKWWPRLLDMYEKRGTPLDPNQRHELLARLCMRPYSTIKLIEHCIKHALDCKWEHLPNTS